MSTSLSPRYQEKVGPQSSDMFASYVNRHRLTTDQNDTASILAQTKIFEEEMVTLRNLYEHEVEDLRGKLQEVSLDRSRLEIENSKNSRLANDLQDRVNISNQQISRQQQELNDCGRLLAQKDAEIQGARTAAMQPTIALESQQRELDHVRRSYEEMNRKLEAEQLRRMEAQEEINRMQQQLSFRDQIHGADTHDLKARLEGSEAMVLALEAKVREMSGGDRNAAEIIQKVKDACDADIRKYQDEVESKYNAGFREFHQQLEVSNSTITSLTNENQELLITVNDLRAQIRSLEVKLSHAEELSRSLQESLDQERFRSRSHLRNMEDKLRQMQDLLIAKVREVDPVSAQGTPMRTEMEALRGMLQDEDKRIEVAQRSQPEISVPIPPISSASPLAPIVRSPAHPSELPAGFGQLASPLMGSKPVGPITASPRGFDDSDIGHHRSPDISKLPPRPHSTPVAPLGQGRDYFDSMFNDLKRDTVFTKVHPKSSPPGGRPQWSSTSHDYHIATTSATGNLKILEVNQDGHFVRIFNQATNIDEEIGGYMIQQNVGGHPVAVYRFPPRTRLKAAQTATVWAAVAASTARHNPPTDFLWKEQHKWGTGPECTTILCKANGQAIAWTTAAHRFAKSVPSYDSSDDEGEQNSTDQEKETQRFGSPFGDETDRQNSRGHSGVTSREQPQVPFLRREKESPPSLSPDKHPHGGHPGMPTHPQYGEERALILGNDNSSALRQSRTQLQNGRPDPVPGTLYAGGARAGSAPLRKYVPANAGTNRLTKSADPVHYGPPSPFTSPLQQRYAKSQYQGMDFMTYPPKVVSPWHSGFGP
ncbi:lamin-B2-like isoform X2 [Branchiostoma floridae]|uniref:Lamin-B2-like isoform X2 n=1 Tax=Branchiostoma floridae TaxID=7739 RepID=A0A9J7MNG3_BRAFL|nr:lamin-B2-like isoform X2 [Branchiostoma floridae]